MKPESELQAEETAFINTCEKHSLLLAVLDRGRHQFELCVHDPDSGEVLARFGTYNKHTAEPPCATTLEDIEAIAADGYDGPVVLTAATIQMIATTLREIAHQKVATQAPATTPDELIELADSSYDGPVVLQNKTLRLLTDQLVAARNRIDDDTETINKLRTPTPSEEPPLTMEEMGALVRSDKPLMVHGFPALGVDDDMPKATMAEAFSAVGLPPPPMGEFEAPVSSPPPKPRKD